ncbi:RICIN domain-containing protein [Kineosporia sp. NBRC 101731]|uniref:RICIN domain-containing protein n=1 Tax=Kineosporia sp. NBRC 101731 TaxID=3032199 RepID=UPI0024A338AE|nr:RICIN domain-containing protein [Kineosporia sp. NBRC 101731]GLY29330.1 hypothetical protein Kisp02_26950 [Kineosporia sp. NBRC 101731]
MHIRTLMLTLAAAVALSGTTALAGATTASAAVPTAGAQTAAATSGYHQIKNQATGQCVDAPGGRRNERLRLVDCSSATTQKWGFTELEPGVYQLRNQHSSYCMEVNNGTSVPGEAVDQYDCSIIASSEKWVQDDFTVFGTTYARFLHQGTNLCLDTVSGRNSQLMQWTCDPEGSNGAQSWRIL